VFDSRPFCPTQEPLGNPGFGPPMTLQGFFQVIGKEIEDPEDETFLLFSQSIPSQDLGFVDAKATDLEISISGRDLAIVQSPGLLSSDREEGTTGAVLWRITPLFAAWITSEHNFLFRAGVIDRNSEVLELGCGTSGIVAIMLAPKIGRYIATDQNYVFKLLKSNVENNPPKQKASNGVKRQGKAIPNSRPGSSRTNIELLALDWEGSLVSNLSSLIGSSSNDDSHTLDAVIACDCVYHEALVDPLVRTSAEICQLANLASGNKMTLCIVAQQLRSHLVFEAWLLAFHKVFRVWRVPDELLTDGLRQGSGYVVHVGVLRGNT